MNGKELDLYDFGSMEDTGCGTEEDDVIFGCACKEFVKKTATQEVLNEYGITQEEYDYICKVLEDELYVGKCSDCF